METGEAHYILCMLGGTHEEPELFIISEFFKLTNLFVNFWELFFLS